MHRLLLVRPFLVHLHLRLFSPPAPLPFLLRRFHLSSYLLPSLKLTDLFPSGLFSRSGVTGSGKTHTMQGLATSSKESGIIPRTIKALFQKQARMKKVRIEVSMEYLEIYCDDCFDLLTEPPVGVSLRRLSFSCLSKLLTSSTDLSFLLLPSLFYRENLVRRSQS